MICPRPHNFIISMLLAIVAMAAAAPLASAQPVINSFSVQGNSTAGGGQMTILGEGFVGAGATQVTIGGAAATVVTAAPNQLDVIIPAGQGADLPVIVFVDGKSAIAPQLFSYPPPAIAMLTPASGPFNESQMVTISGQNFGLTPTVSFGGQAAIVQSSTHTSITVLRPTAPPGVVNVSVNVASQSSNTIPYEYTRDFDIFSITPDTAPTVGGVPATIIGQDIIAPVSVTIGGVSAPVKTVSAAAVEIIIPAGQGANLDVVVNSAGAMATLEGEFSYAAPVINSLIPSSGPLAGGDVVEIDGFNFGVSGVVTFGGAAASVQQWTHNQIAVIAPAGAAPGSVNVVVTVSGQSSNAATYTYDPTISITQIVPDSGPTAGGPSNPLIIQGAGFGPDSAVTIGGFNATVDDIQPDQITAFTPPGEGVNLDVVVTSGGESATLPNAFSYFPPSILSVTPTSGPLDGGQMITIEGSNFGLNPAVFIGGVAATILPPTTHTQIMAVTPAGASTGPTSVVVTVAGQNSNAGSYTYTSDPAVTIEAVIPSMIPTIGALEMAILGEAFGGATSVTIGGALADVIEVLPQRIVVIAPEGEGANLDVAVQSGGGMFTLEGALSYQPPRITGFSRRPNGHVEIFGANFGVSAPVVTFDSLAGAVIMWEHDRLLVAPPQLAPGQMVEVLVNAAGQPSAPAGYTPPADCPADLSGDGSIGSADLAILLGSWGPCP